MKSHGGNGNDRIELGEGNDKGYGDAGDDRITGEGGNDILYGGTGNDIFYAGNGDDQIRGDAGRDTILGEAGSDSLWGGADADRFAFKGTPALTGQDMVMDFQDGLDVLIFENLGIKKYANTGAAGTAYAYDQSSGDVLIKGL